MVSISASTLLSNHYIFGFTTITTIILEDNSHEEMFGHEIIFSLAEKMVIIEKNKEIQRRHSIFLSRLSSFPFLLLINKLKCRKGITNLVFSFLWTLKNKSANFDFPKL